MLVVMVDTVVTIGYSTSWRQVEAMLLEATRRTRDILSPPPYVRQTALSDYYVGSFDRLYASRTPCVAH